jgi:hypothetical protein
MSKTTNKALLSQTPSIYKGTPVQTRDIRNDKALDLNAEELSKIFGT